MGLFITYTNLNFNFLISAWAYGIGFVTLVVFISNIGVFLGPCMKTKAFKRILMFCVALAVGTLAATGFMVLIPEVLVLLGQCYVLLREKRFGFFCRISF